MREIEPKLKEIREKHKDDRQEQAQAMMAVYQEAGMNPLASVFLILLQIPIIIALYFAVSKGGGVPLPDINVDLLYSFVAAPVEVTMNFIGLVDMTGRSLLLALAAGVTQFIHVNYSMPKLPPRDPEAAPSLKDDFARNMQTQMRYVMPIFITFIAYSISAAIALYFFVSNLTMIAQELYVKRHR